MAFTNYIQQIKGTNNTTYDLVDSSASHFVKGTQTAATNVWTGALPDGVTAYYDGLSIDYFLPYAGTSTAATLNLGGKGAKPVYVGNGTDGVTTHFPQYSVIHLTYLVDSALNSGNGCWKVTGYYNTNNMVTQSHSTSNTNYDMALSYYTSDSGGTNLIYHSNKIKGNPSMGRVTTEDLSSSAVTNFISELNVSGASINLTQADWIVEQGVNGIWMWRKWNSGLAECWGQYTYSATTSTVWASPLYSSDVAAAQQYPFEFVSIPMEWASVDSSVNALWLYKQDGQHNTTSQTAVYVPIKVNAFSSNTLDIRYYVAGRWK